MADRVVHLQIKNGTACGHSVVDIERVGEEVSHYHQAVNCSECRAHEKFHDPDSNEHRSICRRCRFEWSKRP